MRFHTSPDAAAAKLPFSQAVQVGDVLYLPGALGHKPGTREVVAGGIEAETGNDWKNIGAVLKATPDLRRRVRNARRCSPTWPSGKTSTKFIPPIPTSPGPARSAFGASALALGAQVELNALAGLCSKEIRSHSSPCCAERLCGKDSTTSSSRHTACAHIAAGTGIRGAGSRCCSCRSIAARPRLRVSLPPAATPGSPPPTASSRPRGAKQSRVSIP